MKPDSSEGIETRVLLLRHAETAAPELFHGAESDVALGEGGHRQAREAAEALSRLRVEAVYSSNMRRARETLRPIAERLGLEPRIEPALHERRMGPLSGRRKAEVWSLYEEARQRWERGELEASHEGAESYAQIRERVVPVFEALAARHRGQTVVVVAHGVVIRVLLTSLLADASPAQFERFGIDFTAVNDLRLRAGQWRAEALNAPAEAVR